MTDLILNTNFETVDIVEDYDSFIWTDRYFKPGDFELYFPLSTKILDTCKENFYVWSEESDRLMIIEDLTIETDHEDGNFLSVTGRSLESILDRRVIWGMLSITGNIQNGIKKILDECFISPLNPDRTVSQLVFEASTDPDIVAMEGDAQFTGDNVLNVIQAICETFELGFRLRWRESDNKFVFSLYKGLDRSYDQIVNSRIMFSPSFDNLGSSRYFKSIRNLKTITLIGGEGEGADRIYTTTTIDSPPTGLLRREYFTDARSVSSKVDGGTISPSEYIELLKQKGKEKLAEHVLIETFDGQIEHIPIHQYMTDYYMGDIVQIENEHGLSSRSRVTEFIRSRSPSGIEMYPTLEKV